MTTSQDNNMRPLDLVNVLEQLPPDVVGAMVLEQLDGDDIRSFKLVAPSTLALVRRTSRVLCLGCRGAQDTLPDRSELALQAEMLSKYEACMAVDLDVESHSGIAPAVVGINRFICYTGAQQGRVRPRPPENKGGALGERRKEQCV